MSKWLFHVPTLLQNKVLSKAEDREIISIPATRLLTDSSAAEDDDFVDEVNWIF